LRLSQWRLAGLSEEAAAALRAQLDARLRAASEGAAPLPDAAAEAHGREVWARCEALTAGLVGELAEQLRLILEPTLASRLAGDYRSGKRINMKKVSGGGMGRQSSGFLSAAASTDRLPHLVRTESS
jgi:midasin